jgi:hypothetical protein
MTVVTVGHMARVRLLQAMDVLTSVARGYLASTVAMD